MPRGLNHKHLCSLGPSHGEQVWLTLAETREGQFVLEDAHTHWPDNPHVIEHGCWPPHEKLFDSKREALIRAAHIITERYGTDLDQWLDAAGITLKETLS